jgi:hypothetical protein
MKFTITVARVEYLYHDFEIDADTPEQAEELARIAAQDVTDWNLVESEQFVNEVRTDNGQVVYSGR